MIQPINNNNNNNSNNDGGGSSVGEENHTSSSVLCDAPEYLPDPKATDAMLVNEMNQLSVEEREIIYEDIHGVPREAINEEPNFVNQRLYELQSALYRIRDKPAFDIAYSQSPDYVGGRDFYLIFLRSTNFDPKEAATKMISYFEHKRLYFGDAILGRPILYSDLNEKDLAFLKSGWMQVLPFRDKAGRVVFWADHRGRDNTKNVENCLRALWYGASVVLTNFEDQKRGFVSVACGDTALDLSVETRIAFWHIAKFISYVPLKFNATHFCVENPGIVFQLISLTHHVWGKTNRIRNRIHQGTQTEWMYKIMTFGIPVEYAPLTSSGQLKTKFYRDFLTQCHLMEEKTMIHKNSKMHTLSSSSFSKYNNNDIFVFFPRRTDVLSGKGSVAQQYCGNINFYQYVDDQLESYKIKYLKESSRQKKQDIIATIWKLLQKEEGIRFLERDATIGCWKVINDETEIFNKIIYRLRLKPKKKNKAPASSANKKSGSKNNHDYETTTNDNDNHDGPSFFNHNGGRYNNNEGIGDCGIKFCHLGAGTDSTSKKSKRTRIR